jgi:5'-deoxynucleotidase YfbR-like HD superfamily hydrolase
MKKLETSTRVKAIREAAFVSRCHAKTLFREYSVGHHSFNMAALISILHPNPSPTLYRAVLWHDVPERWTGDIPTPLKQQFPEIKEKLAAFETILLEQLTPAFDLNRAEKQWLKAVDMLDLWLWAREEVALGNTSLSGMQQHCVKILNGLSERGLMPANALFFFLEEKKTAHTFLSDVTSEVFTL